MTVANLCAHSTVQCWKWPKITKKKEGGGPRRGKHLAKHFFPDIGGKRRRGPTVRPSIYPPSSFFKESDTTKSFFHLSSFSPSLFFPELQQPLSCPSLSSENQRILPGHKHISLVSPPFSGVDFIGGVASVEYFFFFFAFLGESNCLLMLYYHYFDRSMPWGWSINIKKRVMSIVNFFVAMVRVITSDSCSFLWPRLKWSLTGANSEG